MKKLYLLIFTLILFLPLKLNATTAIVNEPTGINIRTGSGTNYDVVVAVAYNRTISINNTSLIKCSNCGCDDGWYSVSYDGYGGYACSTYLTLNNSGDSLNYNGTFSARVYSDYVSVRNIASSSGSLVDKLTGGSTVNVISSWPSGNGCDDIWYYITYNNGKTGYSCSTYVKKYNDLVLESNQWSDEEKEYANKLLTSGFKESYLPYLMKLHKNHPNWNFIPYVSSESWNNVISGEEGKNKIESTTTTNEYLPYYVTSMIGTEGGNWYYTNNGVNAYYLDPRNFLSDSLIFMFEDLGFNSTYHTDDILKAFLGSNWLNTDTYRKYILDAAKNNAVSPLHLIARIFKEGAGNANYGPVTGNSNQTYGGCSLNGFYNFYNIGSYSDWVQGLYYAAGYDSNCKGTYTSYGRPWDSIEKAINGGANFISEDYIKIGQNTLYFQKFNTKVAPLYTHQYMTNVMAPVQESESIYNLIKSYGLLEKNYTFIIPVYQDMPNSVLLPGLSSSNNNLTEIKINSKLIDSFDTDVLEYSYYIKDNISKINISAKAEDSKSIISGTGDINIDSGTQEIKITVTAQNGQIKTYKIFVTKVSGEDKSIEDITSNLSTKINGNNMGGISPKTDSSSLINTIKSIDPTASITYKDAKGTTIKGTTNLKTGDTLRITSSNNETVTYTIVVNGDSSGDGLVTIFDLLKTQKHILKSTLLSGPYALAGDTNNDNNITILDLLRVQKYILGSLTL